MSFAWSRTLRRVTASWLADRRSLEDLLPRQLIEVDSEVYQDGELEGQDLGGVCSHLGFPSVVNGRDEILL